MSAWLTAKLHADANILEEFDELNEMNVKHQCVVLFIDILEIIGAQRMYNELLMIAASKNDQFDYDGHKYKENTEKSNSFCCCCSFGNVLCLIVGMLIMYLYQNGHIF